MQYKKQSYFGKCIMSLLSLLMVGLVLFAFMSAIDKTLGA